MVEKKKTNKKPKKKKEKVCETFEIEKNGKEKEVVSCGDMEVKEKSIDQIKEENRILRNIFISIGIVVLILLGITVYVNLTSTFEINGAKFEMEKYGELLFYKYGVPIGEDTTFNIYIRNDPRDLEKKVPFNGTIDLEKLRRSKFFVINEEGDYFCSGKGTIATPNLAIQLYQKLLEAEILTDPNATCSNESKYMYVNIIDGNETRIDEINDNCFEITIANCEILEGTERFMLETFYEIEKLRN
jgi:hypothetical protein